MFIILLGCASGGPSDNGDADQGDGGTTRIDGGRRDGGSCPPGQHACGGGCVADLANDPEVGCRYGCGEPCPAPPDGAASCTAEGTCTFGCEPPFMLVAGECTCVPRTCEALGFECGAPDDGCGTPLDCGACGAGRSCSSGHCSCPLDEREPNETASAVSAASIAHIPDVNEWVMTFNAWNLHSSEDEDWYRFEVTDTGLDNPTLTILLEGIPSGSDFELEAYYRCDEGLDVSTCTPDAPCISDEGGSDDEGLAIDVDCERGLFDSNDSGALFIRVFSYQWGGTCAPYSLTVHSAS